MREAGFIRAAHGAYSRSLRPNTPYSASTLRARLGCYNDRRSVVMVLQGQVALVTGAGRGIGRASALALARAGARVAVNDLDPQPASETVAEVRKAGGQALALPGDVAVQETVDSLV